MAIGAFIWLMPTYIYIHASCRNGSKQHQMIWVSLSLSRSLNVCVCVHSILHRFFYSFSHTLYLVLFFHFSALSITYSKPHTKAWYFIIKHVLCVLALFRALLYIITLYITRKYFYFCVIEKAICMLRYPCVCVMCECVYVLRSLILCTSACVSMP